MKKWIINYLAVPWRTLGLIIRTIATIRYWIKDQLVHPVMQSAFKWAVSLTALAWLVIWIFRDKYRDNLDEAIKGLL